MRTGVAAAIAVALTCSSAWLGGCGSDASIVGGECIAGYRQCGSTCCPVPRDGGVGADRDAMSPYDAAAGDGATRNRPGDAGGDGGGDANEGAEDGGSDAPGAIDDGGGSSDAGSGGSGDSGAGASGDSGVPGDGGFGGGSGDGAPEGGASEEAGSEDASGATGGEAGPSCVSPQIACDGRCIDPTSDPYNCGSCGNVCPSMLCADSICVGSTVGGIVFIGHDYTASAGAGPAVVLANSVFMPRSNPLRVLSYERYAQAAALSNVHAVLADTATALGRHLATTTTVSDGDIPAHLDAATYDVLLVHDQTTAARGAMATLGATWAPTLTTFTQQHGIIVILDGGSGVGEMPQFSTATGLLDVMGQTTATSGTPLQVMAPADAVGIGVVSPYAASESSVFLTAEPNGGDVVYVVGTMGNTQNPVVIHKVL